MEVAYALLAEHVSEGCDGKLSVVGIFDVIYAKTAPFIHPRMYAAVRIHSRVSEGSDHSVRLVIVDEDGDEVVTKSPPIPVVLAPGGRAMPMRGIVVTEFVGVVFPRFGDYEFNVFVDERHVATTSFSVLSMDD